ncbi:nitrate- and nitrite sensing domain-containing protein [Pseudonocardia sp. HH130630-07]|uniref:nitrate- and nitrite sensing domain-containing protein n=1 Tax=Pseudonocardia sp. HH130630-07 TaxID=1690815 RepID=UPI0008150F94|nr:nitrate- and nitrite sensing domain-containing protein [Pseudonocardia sp. HH130630-07]ANY07138.1 hypothetical protein AFB00_13565 [Pseudonocardia sp. HH130630-07]
MSTATSTEAPRTLSERLDPRNWSLVAKLAVVGLVPTVLALTIGAIRVIDQANVAEELGRGSALVDVHQQIDALSGALQAERDAAVVFVSANRPGDRLAVDNAQTATDEALRDTTELLGAAVEQAPQLATARRQAETTLSQLPVIRFQVAEGPSPVADVSSRYTSVVQRVLGLDRALVGQLQTTETSGLTSALGSGANAAEAIELERSVVNGALAAGRLDEAQRALLTGADATFQTAAGDFQASLSPEQADAFGNFAAAPPNFERDTLRDRALAAPPDAPLDIDPLAWKAAVDRSAEAIDQSTGAAEQAFVDGRNAAAEEAGNTAGLNSVLLMLTLLLTGGIVLLLGRQMVRSLRLLRSSALEVAERKLPAAVQSVRSGQAPNAVVEPVPVDSRDEIGEVARAFDAVHGQAIRLAADQAALQQNVNSMFVNLSRRSQALVERQLQLIEQLESNEQDADQLSNLFQLDHLATRMRRNSENLLVLAGTDLAKRNVAPVQVVDVLRAAVSEVEQYQRVIVQTPPNATIAGRAANDLVHLLAELLDNATNFSPPDSQVVMSTTRTADESLLVEISDRGVGMTGPELNDANQRLSGPSEVDVSASRRMGLFVVGRLASRHRIGVRLSGTAGGGAGGLNASVIVPPLLVPSAALPEQRRDGGQQPWGQDAPALPPGPPAPGNRAPEAPVAPVGGAPAPVSAVNGSGRGGSLPSLVAGSDGPLTPTFEAGHATTGGARNGSLSALPTRTPGSSLRRNAQPGDAAGEEKTSTNGVAPGGGAQAFLPSRDGGTAEPTSSDFFTPADQKPRSSGRGGTEPGGTGPKGLDALRGRPGTPDRPTGTGAGDAAGTGEQPAVDGQSPRPAAGTAAALGLGLAGAAGRSGTDGRREMDDTVVIGAAVDDDEPAGTPAPDTDGPATASTDTASTDTDGSDAPVAGDRPATADRTSADDPGTTADAEQLPAEPPARETDADAGRTTADAGPGDAEDDETSADGPAGTADVRAAGGVTDTQDAGTDATDDPADDAASTGTGSPESGTTGSGAATAGAVAAGAAGAALTGAAISGAGSRPGPDTDDETDDGAGPDTADAGRTAAGRTDPSGTTNRPAAPAAPVAPVAPVAPAASAPADEDTSGPAEPRNTPGTPPGAPTEETSTASFPAVRPSGREPMGGPLPDGHPGPSRRPVMPGGRAPSRGPVPLPQRAPGRGGPGTNGSPAPAPGPNGVPAPTANGSAAPNGSAPNGSAPNGAGPNGTGPNGGPGVLPKRPVRGPAGPAPAAPPGEEELFAPKVPVEGDRGQLRKPGAMDQVRAHNGSAAEGGPTTPIFDDIASAWFRSNRSVPVRWQDGSPAQTGGPATAERTATAAPATRTRTAEENGAPDFASPADEVWRQAQEAGDAPAAEVPDEQLTQAGLPKRRPRARLLPGSAAGSTVLSPAPAAEPRDAESVRGRLASYQQGVRQGRESASSTRRTTSAAGSPEPSAERQNSSDPEETP